MPFIGKDWRSPGEAWVKTESLGWQRMKIIESQLHPNCHQAYPACSWPPQAQFGHHMANNCAANSESNNESPLLVASSQSSSPSESSCRNINRNNVLKRQTTDSLSAGSCSSNSSCTNSASASPTGSPEKSSPSSASHHLHPITISSPYGQFTCCTHHYGPDYSGSWPCSSPRSPNKVAGCASGCTRPMSKSLSRESIQQQQQTEVSGTPGVDYLSTKKVLRHNNSCSDFRNPTCEQCPPVHSITMRGLGNHDNNSSRDEIEISNSSGLIGVPILMENGLRIPRDEPAAVAVDEQRNDQAPDGVDKDGQAHLVRPERVLNAGHPVGSICCCCCCCGPMNQQQHNCSPNSLQEQQPKTAPHCRISVRTREVAMYNTISEAFYRLDFCNAIHDIRRFNYICKLLHLLITQNLTSLSGCATKVLFTMLEQVAWEVSSNKRNIHVLKNLLAELRQMIQKYYCWGRPIGSSLLWQQHFDTIERISQIVDGIELSPTQTSSASEMTFDKLPVEMIREILLRLNDYRDLVNSAQATPLMRTMIDSQIIWQKLCHYHFTDQQLRLALRSHELSKSNSRQATSLRGVKYARTTSADGQSSFRNPVRITRQQQRVTQQQQSSTSLNNKQNQAPSVSGGGSSSSSRQTANPNRRGSSSYVTKAIRIFDRKSSLPDTVASYTLRRVVDSREPGKNSRSEGAVDKSRLDVESRARAEATTSKQQQATDSSTSRVNPQLSSAVPGSTTATASANNRIDWEQLFHQLRKRFDLKEEYADCLLLCRHCRCLFWKSFGHPCIKGADLLADNGELFQSEEVHPTSGPASRPRVGFSETRDGISGAPPSSASSAEENHNPRRAAQQRSPSVALLSRNFDHNPSSAQRGPNQPTGQAMQQPTAQQDQMSNRVASQRRNPLNELNARFQARDQMFRDNHRLNQQQQRNANDDNGATIKRELVPQHVTITPQAFLKFFSL